MQAVGSARGTSPGQPVFEAERVAHNRRGLWVAIGLALLGQIVFVLLFNVLPPFSQKLDGLPLVLIGLALSLIPAALWLIFFYSFDRAEPEPKHGVMSIFVIGALITGAIIEPVLHGFFDIDAWLYDSWWTQLFGGILVVGILQTLTIYAAVRYFIYFQPEFDERIDGVIYGVAAGLGLATMLNFGYILAHGGVDLDVGSVRMVINALAYASFGGILGYFLGQTRFESTPIHYLPTGFALAAAFNGLFFFLEDRITASGLQATPRNGLILAGVLAVVSLALVFWLIQRANEETLRLAKSSKESA